MPTKLSKPVSRETRKVYNRRPVIVTLAPAGDDALIGFRLKGDRLQYVCSVSSIYQMAALWHGQKVAIAKRKAKKEGVPWRKARKVFNEQNRIPNWTGGASFL